MLQTECKLMDLNYNLAMTEKLIEKAANQNAKIVCLPEFFSTGYKLNEMENSISDLCLETKNTTMDFLKNLAKKFDLYIIAGLIFEDDEKNCLNAAVFIDRNGEHIGTYSKNHLFGDEKKHFHCNGKYPVFDTEFGKIGILICYDNNFPESSRMLALQGAEIIFCPCAWRIQEREIFTLLNRSHACENGLFFCSVNQYKNDEDLFLFGNSTLSNPKGEIIATCNDTGEDVVCIEIDLAKSNEFREMLPIFKDRHPHDYKLISM